MMQPDFEMNPIKPANPRALAIDDHFVLELNDDFLGDQNEVGDDEARAQPGATLWRFCASGPDNPQGRVDVGGVARVSTDNWVACLWPPGQADTSSRLVASAPTALGAFVALWRARHQAR